MSDRLNDSSGLSLLSLSIAAANATPIAVTMHPEPATGGANGNHNGPVGATQGTGGAKHHRRLSSTGKARRRLSDARDAATRPSPAALPATGAALSLASLSISSSLPTQGLPTAATSVTFPTKSSTTPHTAIPIPINRKSSSSSSGTPKSAPLEDGSAFAASSFGAIHNGDSNRTVEGTPVNGVAIHGTKGGKKKGMDHKCETCSKIYRHPSCLIKHRWEHTPHWREASKFVLSKHQQVQLLEAAAILSHLSPSSSTGTSLPEDRSLWPSFLSGGTLPPPSITDISANGAPILSGHPISSSVPSSSGIGSTTRATSAGPRLHDYAIPASANGSGGITQLRPGLLGVPNGPGISTSPTPTADVPIAHGSLPVPVPLPNAIARSVYHNGEGGVSESWGSTHASPQYGQSYQSSSSVAATSTSGAFVGVGGWSLPRSSLRSVSGSSRSRSGSGSRSDNESEPVDVDVDVELLMDDGRQIPRAYGFSSRGRTYSWKKEEEELRLGFSVREEDEYEVAGRGGRGKDMQEEEEGEGEAWDGMDMEMEMD